MYQTRKEKTLYTLPGLIASAILALCALSATAGTSGSAASIFNYPSGFSGAAGPSGPAIRTAWGAQLQGSAINLLGQATVHDAGGAWYMVQQNIAAFTTDFTFQIAAPSSIPATVGFTFCIQNSNSTTNPYLGEYGINAAADSNLSGYGAYDPAQIGASQHPVGNSVAIKFDTSGNGINTYPVGGSPSATGLYINGGPYATLAPLNDLNPYGINLNSGHVMAAHIVYDGGILTMVLKDTVTNAQFRTSWPIAIPSITGSNSAWVGFTAGEIPVVAVKILSWDYSTGYDAKLNTPTLSIAGGSYTSSQSVSISADSGATIYYTTNGQQPTSSSSKYIGPISVNSSEVVQAVAIETGYTDSNVAIGNYQIAPSGTPLINFPSGFSGASGLITPVGYAKFVGSQIQLTDTNSSGQEVGAAWYDIPVSVNAFTTHFTLQFTSANANGMTFCIQNQPAASLDKSILWVSGGPNALASGFTGLGYSSNPGSGQGTQTAGLLSSVAVKFDLTNNSTGIYTNGSLPTTPQSTISGVSLNSGHPLNVTLTYNGTTLSLSITDSVTQGTYTTSFSIDIPTTVGASNAYVGFTGATGYSFANQYIAAWTYSNPTSSSPAVPAAPTNLRVQ